MTQRRVSLVSAALAVFAVVGLVWASQPAEPPAQPTGPAPSAAQPKEDFVYVLMTTSHGDIKIELDNAKAPISTQNFLNYVDKKSYDGTIFHRVMKGFMIQGGGYDQDLTERSSDKRIKNEWQNGLKNKRGTIAMARLGYQADSASRQFFINTGKRLPDGSWQHNDALDQPRDGSGYAVFGKVVDGMDVVDKIESEPTGVRGGMENVPVKAVMIKGVRRMTPEEVAKLPKAAAEPKPPPAPTGSEPKPAIKPPADKPGVTTPEQPR